MWQCVNSCRHYRQHQQLAVCYVVHFIVAFACYLAVEVVRLKSTSPPPRAVSDHVAPSAGCRYQLVPVRAALCAQVVPLGEQGPSADDVRAAWRAQAGQVRRADDILVSGAGSTQRC